MERNLAMELVRVTEAAALASARFMGRGDEMAADVAAIEGAAICAAGGYNALSVISIAEHGTFLRVPDTYMEKIACGPEGRGLIDLDKSPTDNLRALADA